MSKIKVAEIAPSSSNTPSITLGANSNVTFANGVTATSFTGDGANLTNVPAPSTFDAANLTGTIPNASLPNPLPAIDGSALTGIAAGGGGLEFISKTVVPSSGSNTFVDITSGISNDGVYKIIGEMKFGSSYTSLQAQLFLNGSSTVNNNSWYSYRVFRELNPTGYAYSSNASFVAATQNPYQLFNFEMTFSTADPCYVHIKGVSLYPDYFSFVELNGGLNSSYATGYKISGIRFSNQAGDVLNNSKILLYKYKES